MENKEIGRIQPKEFQTELHRQARSLVRDKRREIITSFSEIQLHKHLKELFQAMQPEYVVDVTHGTTEFGKDLVLVKSDHFTTDVIGVVVKCGDISGSSAGDVDDLKLAVKTLFSSNEKKRISEIESQVEQALAHPAEIGSFVEALPVNKVIVILAGKLSKNARQRLEAEVPKGSQIFDLEWLVDNFTSHYPQVFYDGKTIDFVQQKIQELETRNWMVKSHKNLTEYYVEPLVTTAYAPDLLTAKELISLIERRPTPLSSLQTLLSKKQKVILAGDPGTGKSAALAMLAITMLKDAYSQASATHQKKGLIGLPIFVTASELAETEGSQQMLTYYCKHSEIQHRFEPYVLLVDGLDEVASGRREEVLEKASRYADELNCSLILTSRKIDIINLTPTGFEKFELLPFEIGQAVQFYQRLFVDAKHISALQEGIERIQWQIPITPLSLVLLLKLVEEHEEVPASVTELYDRYVDAVLGREDKAKGINVLFDYFVKKGFLANFAYNELLAKNRLSVSSIEFDDFVISYTEQYNLNIDRVDSFLEELKRSAILDFGETIQFKHRSFLDYFAAFYIIAKQDDFDNISDFISKLYYDETWSEVAFFFIGLKREISDRVLLKILDFVGSSPDIAVQKFMIGRLLQAGWFSLSSTKTTGIEKAFELTNQIQDEFLECFDQEGVQIPRIYGSFFILMLADHSFKSGFLKNEIKAHYQKVCETEGGNSFLKKISMLSVLKPFLTTQEFDQEIIKSIDVIDRDIIINPQQRASALLLLKFINGRNRATKRIIENHLGKLGKDNPDIFTKLLPVKKDGFRK